MEKFKVDDLDLNIIEMLLKDSNVNFKKIAELLKVNEKIIARRIERLVKNDIIKNYTINVNWKKLGFQTEAFVCIKTGSGEYLTKDIRNFIEQQPRIIKAVPTVGAYEYILHVLSKDIFDFRTEVGTLLEPLTTDCSTSIVAGFPEALDYNSLLKLVKENKNVKNEPISDKKEPICKK